MHQQINYRTFRQIYIKWKRANWLNQNQLALYLWIMKFCCQNVATNCGNGYFPGSRPGFFTFWIIPTRQNKSQSKQFCIGDLTLFGFIWFQISISHRVSDFLLSKIYQGVIAMIANVTEQTMLQSSYEIILPRSCLLCKR